MFPEPETVLTLIEASPVRTDYAHLLTLGIVTAGMYLFLISVGLPRNRHESRINRTDR